MKIRQHIIEFKNKLLTFVKMLTTYIGITLVLRDLNRATYECML